MSRKQLIAAAVVALTFSAAAQAANQNFIASADSQGSQLSSVTVFGNAAGQDYTGVVPAPKASNVSVWTPAAAHDYTGDVSVINEELVARSPLTKLALAHDYAAQ